MSRVLRRSNNHHSYKFANQRGFTLIELTITIVVTAIMIMGVAGFVELGTKGYSDTVDRQALQNQARFVIEKMTREIRHAVPNSFEISDKNSNGGYNCLSFYPIKYAGTYSSMPTEGGGVFRFVTVNAEPSINSLKSKYLVINPNSPQDLETDATNSMPIDNDVTKLKNNLPLYSASAESGFSGSSVGNRLYIYKEKVTYCIVETAITRQEDDGAEIQVGQNVVKGSFNDGTGSSSGSASLFRSGLVHLAFLFQRGDEQSPYESDVQVLNVP